MTSEWPEVVIADVCELMVDCVNRTAPISDAPTPYKMIRTTNVRDGWVDTEAVRYVDEATFVRWTRRGAPRLGDVILTREAPLGEVGMLRSSEPIFLGQRLYMYRADPLKLDNRFLLYSMLDEYVQGQIQSYGSGSTVEHMRLPDCEKLRFRLPQLPTQRKIATVLSSYDDLIENNSRRITILDEMVRRIYREWFVDFRYPGHENVPLVPSELGPIPEGWGWRTLGRLAEDVRNGVEPRAVDSDTPYIGLEHLPQRSIAIGEWATAADAGSSKLAFEVGDVLFGKIRPYFHKVAAPPVAGICSTDAIVIRARVPEFTGLVLATVSSDAFVEQAVQTSQGTKMPRANWKVLEGYSVAVPHRELLSRFDAVMSDTVDMIHRLVIANRTLRATRDLLLPRLISGHIDVERLEIQVPAVA